MDKEATKSSGSDTSLPKSPVQHGIFRLPSPFIHRRQRTVSVTEAAAEGPVLTGTVKDFCRNRGHGWIQPSEPGSEALFVHISDIEGEYVPIAGDDVTYQTCLTPPKMEKLQAVHVKITHLKEDTVHQRWDNKPVH